jgi:cation diffusion facilitator family transporter
MFVNAGLAAIKLVAGLVGNAYALVADAVESLADVFASLIVWSGLAIASRPPDEDHPYGHGKAEALAAAVVSVMLLIAAVGIGVQAVHEIRTPHSLPALWTLAVLVGVMIAKWTLARRISAVSVDTGSTAVRADAAHHLSDAITSGAAFIGISIALIGGRWAGGGTRWAAADDWAALVASGVIAFNGVSMLRAVLHDLMDRMPEASVVEPVRRAALAVPGVLAVEKLHLRKAGLNYRATIHVHAAPTMPLSEAHALGGQVKRAIQAAVPQVASVLVHMEPFEMDPFESDGTAARDARHHRSA